MRVIQHKRYSQKKSKSKRVGLLVSVALLVSAGVIGTVMYRNQETKQEEQKAVLAQEQFVKPINENPSDDDFKFFAGDEFKKLYENIAYPNTQLLLRPPVITGNEAADNRIRTIALSRGYALRSVPVAPIEKTNEPGLGTDDLLQQKARESWIKLKDAAAADGIPLKLNSGYRSVEMQRQLFVSRLRATGATNAQIASGTADAAVVATLTVTAIPGYSRHHTGYTIDLLCGNAVQAFETTRCFKWLSENNYLNAKKSGWVPSYPEGANNQGPEPESWEYVWVGTQAVLKD